MKTPYQEAVELIDRHPGTGSSTGLAKLILSLWNEECAYSFRECGLRREEQLGPAAIARRLGIGRASVYRLLGKQTVGSANGGADADQG